MRKPYYLLLVLFILSLAFYGCNGDGVVLGERAPAEDGAGPYSISLMGGDGTGGSPGWGGDGGKIDVESYLDVIFSQFGEVDTSFAVPNYGAPVELGGACAEGDENPAIATALDCAGGCTPALLNAGDADPGDGEPYMVKGHKHLYIGDGDGNVPEDDEIATGLRVESGATAILPLNYWGGSTAKLKFDCDVDILGTLRTENRPESLDRGNLKLEAYRIFLGPNGLIDTSGDDAVANNNGDHEGGDAGFIKLRAEFNIPGSGGIFLGGSGKIDASGGDGANGGDGGHGNSVKVYSSSVIVNKADVDASGGSGAGGGDAGDVHLAALQSVYNTGLINGSGGTGTDGYGGGGEDTVTLTSCFASTFNSGDLNANGGDGTQGGGHAGDVSLEAGTGLLDDEGQCMEILGFHFFRGCFGCWKDSIGNVTNSGALLANGGSVTADTENAGSGGDGGKIDIDSEGGGFVKTSGSLSANGGAGYKASLNNNIVTIVNNVNGTYYGGDGGKIDIDTDDGTGYISGEDRAPGVIQVTGNISAVGGSAPTFAGNGGKLYVDNDSAADDDLRLFAKVEFFGYGEGIDLSGGDGTGEGELLGGDGGKFEVDTEDASNVIDIDLPTGAIISDVNIVARGGNVTGVGGWYDGGDGGCIRWAAEGDAYIGMTVLENGGDIDVSGGTGVEYGGDSGGISLFGHDGLTNGGKLTANGGEATGDEGVAGDSNGSHCPFGSKGYDNFFAPDWYGFGPILLLSTYNVNNEGAVEANGGNSTGCCGDGGYGAFWVAMYAGGTASNSGNVIANGGDGTYNGGDGGVIDLFSASTATSNTAALLSVVGGAGGTEEKDGDNGWIFRDWVDVTPADGTLP